MPRSKDVGLTMVAFFLAFFDERLCMIIARLRATL